MARKLNQREKRTLLFGAIVAVAIPVFAYGMKCCDHWRGIRVSLAKSEQRLNDIVVDESKQAGLLSIVPILEPPEAEETQKFLFRDKLHEQLKKAGIKNEPLSFLPARRTTKVPAGVPNKVLRIKCKGKCKFTQLLDFLAVLQENPYLLSVEELSIECDTKKPPEQRQDIEIELTVSTFVK